MSKKILILGANGLIGNNLTKYLIKKKLHLFPAIRSKKKKFLRSANFLYYGNLSTKKSLKKIENIIKKIKPHFVINCLGITKHKKIKNNTILNIDLPRVILKNKKKIKFKFIHITSDCVFDGKKGMYKENSITNAKDSYGISKATADKILKNNNDVIIIRTSTIGHEINSKLGLLEWFLSQKKTVYGFKNAYFSGPTTLELSKIIYKYIIIKQLIKKGLYNVAGPRINKYKLLGIIKKIYNKEIFININYKFKIDRSLNADKFNKVSKYKTKNWYKMIEECKKFYDKKLLDF
tara:strand:+ start:428 stop:1303 length:876 start_codon:yes stop_codon:yes gene_type:complete